MNLTLENAIFIDQKGEYHEMENFATFSRQIRYIHIPEDVSTPFWQGDPPFKTPF